MYAWRIWYSCVILYASLQRGQTEQIIENDLLDDYDNDYDGSGTDVWAEKTSTISVTEVPTDKSRTASGTSIHAANKSTPSVVFVWNDDNSTSSRTDVSTDDNTNKSGISAAADNVTRPGTDVPIDNNVTRSRTDIPTDSNVTRSGSDTTANLRTGSSKTTMPIDGTGFNTTRFPALDVCKNSSCPDLLILTTTVPEGKNVTLRCGNASDTSPLWWYRDATVLQWGVGDVVLYIADSDRSHSGHYICTDERGCCIVKHHLFVYGVPPYVYHLAVMGAFLVVGITLCVFLSVRRSSKFNSYVRMFNERHGEEKYLIL